MFDPRALQLALDVARMPALARTVRRQPLPPDVLSLMRIAAGSPEAIEDAVRVTGEKPEAVKGAAILFLQQSLLQSDGDHYRTLGVSANASGQQLAEHARWLLKWLHPDHDAAAWDSALAQRVLAAWHELKDPERRARYDRVRAVSSPIPARGESGRRRARPRPKEMLKLPWITVAVTENAKPHRVRQVLGLLILGVVVLFVILVADLIVGPMVRGSAG